MLQQFTSFLLLISNMDYIAAVKQRPLFRLLDVRLLCAQHCEDSKREESSHTQLLYIKPFLATGPNVGHTKFLESGLLPSFAF